MSTTLNLVKGEKIDITKTNPGLKVAAIGLGWDTSRNASTFDLDAFAIALKGKKLENQSDVLYFGSPKTGGKPTIMNESLVHSGDNLTGAGDGDDETIKVELSKIPAELDKVVFCVTIHEGEMRKQNFGQVRNAYIRVINEESGAELARYDLSEDASVETAMIFGELYRNGDDWKFRAVGQGFAGGLAPLATSFGVNV